LTLISWNREFLAWQMSIQCRVNIMVIITTISAEQAAKMTPEVGFNSAKQTEECN